jgi:hypothetical protein
LDDASGSRALPDLNTFDLWERRNCLCLAGSQWIALGSRFSGGFPNAA